jgi:probable rRNA maturation factor
MPPRPEPSAAAAGVSASRLTTHIDIQRRSRASGLPSDILLRRWARAALHDLQLCAAITLRLVGASEGQRLNHNYRGADYATNVLSFEYGFADSETPARGRAAGAAGAVIAAGALAQPTLGGDIVLCVPVIAREAREQGKSLRAHYAHLVIHGVLHLAGIDHQTPRSAARMEARERRLLGALGFADPYLLAH